MNTLRALRAQQVRIYKETRLPHTKKNLHIAKHPNRAIVCKAIRRRQTKQHLINLYGDNNAAGEDRQRTRRISNARNDI